MNKVKARDKDKSQTVLAQIVALNRMKIQSLRTKYVELMGREPPSTSRKQIVTRLAYRIQEIAYGGLSREARDKLENIYGAQDEPQKPIRKKQKKAPVDGTKLVREYMGENHEVTVWKSGFEYEGGMYRSLSAIAKKITGTHTSGPAFFGMSKKGGAK